MTTYSSALFFWRMRCDTCSALRHRASMCLLAVLVGGCGAAQPSTGGARGPGEPAELELPRVVVTPQGASDVPQLLRDAASLARQKRFAEAAAAYDRAYRIEASGEPGLAALFGAGSAYDEAGDTERALSRFQLYAERDPESARGLQALVRATRLLVFLGRYQPAGLNAERILPRLEQLTEYARISVFSAKALGLLARDDDEQASYFIEKGREIVDANGLDRAVPLQRDLAPLYFALGESRRIRAERIKFEPLPPNFGAVLEQRCQLLLDAQSAYADAMRANDAHWSAIAGYRIAELYQNLHAELLSISTPASVTTERERQLYEGAVRTRYAILLTKAETMAEHTLSMAQRTGEHSEWVERTSKALEVIRRGIAEEHAALAKLPYTRQDFEEYFARMEAAAAGSGAPTPGQRGSPRGSR